MGTSPGESARSCTNLSPAPTDEDVYSYIAYADVPPAGERVGIDLAGEAAQAFGRLRPHYGSGLQWGWPVPYPG